MNFTFGLITTDPQSQNVETIFHSIVSQNIPNLQIVIVGGDRDYKLEDKNADYNFLYNLISFDETLKPGWITRKKNIITENAIYENIVYLHDYVKLDIGWYEGVLEYNKKNPSWDLMMTKMINLDGSRYRDWCVWSDPSHGKSWIQYEPFCPNGRLVNGQAALIDYSYNKTEYMYISGGYFVAKKKVMQENPLNEELLWGQSEDLEFSYRVLESKKYRYVINTHSSVSLLKQKDRILPIWK